MGNIARSYSNLGNFKEAEELEVQVLDIQKKLLSAEHLDTLLSMENLSRTYSDLGNFKDVEGLGVLLDI